MESKKEFFNRIYDNFIYSIVSIDVEDKVNTISVVLKHKTAMSIYVSRDYSGESTLDYLLDGIFLRDLFIEYIK